jgi:hypothetical protein
MAEIAGIVIGAVGLVALESTVCWANFCSYSAYLTDT